MTNRTSETRRSRRNDVGAAGLRAGDELELVVDTLAVGGDGIGRVQGMAVFVPGTAVGDRVSVRITEVRKHYARAQVLEVLQPGPMRAEPPCPVYERCGGCQWQHLDYREQLSWKRKHVQEALERIGGFHDVPVKDTLGMQEPWFYRNKAALPIGGRPGAVEIGFYRRGSHDLLGIEACAIQHPLINQVLAAARRIINEQRLVPYDESTGRGLLRHLVVRVGSRTGEALAALVINGDGWREEVSFAEELRSSVPQLVGVLKNCNTRPGNVILGDKTRLLSGRDYLIDELLGLRFEVSIESFYQVNPVQTEVLYRTALGHAALTGVETVFDLYSGIGTISLLMARHAKRVYGVEIVEAAVEDARRNAERNGIRNADFFAGDVVRLLPKLGQEARPDVLVVDPPRKGVEERVLREVIRLQPRRVVYVSCNPTTMARDLAILREGGYRLREAQPVDMFPQTAHVECVVLMSRVEN